MTWFSFFSKAKDLSAPLCKHQQHRPNANLCVFQKSTFYADVRVFNSLPCNLTNLKNEKTKFKVVLRTYLNTHSFYSVDENDHMRRLIFVRCHIDFLNIMRVANCGCLIAWILIHVIFFMGILERESVPKEVGKCSAAQGPHSEVVLCAFWSVEKLRRMQGFVCKRLRGNTVVTLNMFFIRNNFRAYED